MSGDDTVKTCAHGPCVCLMQEEEEFCSEHCEAAAAETECGCGHLACSSHGMTSG